MTSMKLAAVMVVLPSVRSSSSMRDLVGGGLSLPLVAPPPPSGYPGCGGFPGGSDMEREGLTSSSRMPTESCLTSLTFATSICGAEAAASTSAANASAAVL